MPVSQFSEGLKKAVMLLPGTYGTSLLRNHALRGALNELGGAGFPSEAVKAIGDTVDYTLYFFGEAVSVPVMYAVLGGAAVLLAGVYLLMNVLQKKM